MLAASPLEPGERLATVEEIRDCTDVAAMICTPYFEAPDETRTPYWTRSDGSPLKIKVRGLGAKLQHEIRKTAGDDDYLLMIESCFHGIVDPAFSRDQLAIFERKHPGALGAIADTIWGLSELPAQWFETQIRQAVNLDPQSTSG